MNTQLVVACAAMAGTNVEMVVVTEEMAEEKVFKNKNVTQSFPLLEIDNLVLFDTLAIAKYFARRADKKLMGSSALEQALVEEWL